MNRAKKYKKLRDYINRMNKQHEQALKSMNISKRMKAVSEELTTIDYEYKHGKVN